MIKVVELWCSAPQLTFIIYIQKDMGRIPEHIPKTPPPVPPEPVGGGDGGRWERLAWRLLEAGLVVMAVLSLGMVAASVVVLIRGN